MLLLIAVFLAGVLTIVSPCILPVLPFVFARSDQKFLTSGLPLLIGMASTFAGIATLAAVGGAWAIRVNQYGRVLALVLLTVFAATLLSRRVSAALSRPFVALGNRLMPTTPAGTPRSGLIASLLLGAATGLLWAPCAGPILGLVLTGAAILGPNAHTTALLFAYAAGAATSLGVAILAGGRVFGALKRSLGAGEWVRRILGVAVMLGVAAIAMGWDTTVLTRLSLSGTSRIETSLLEKVTARDERSAGNAMMSNQSMMVAGAHAPGPPVEGEIPSLSGATAWLNSPALTPDALRGKVVLVDFWTYSCINCLRSLPYVKAWHAKYKDYGLVVVGVHAPEFAFEKDLQNVRRAVGDLGIEYPVALDDDFAIWRGFDNHYWPAHYFIDEKGQIRGHHFGEGDYDETERTLRELLTAAGYGALPPAGTGTAVAGGAQAASDQAHDQSRETYLGWRRADGFASPGGLIHDAAHDYAVPSSLDLDQWALGGRWSDDPEKATSVSAPARVAFGFQARDLHLVLGPRSDGRPVRYRVRLDGRDPGTSHGVDTDERGNGVVTDQRLYQLIRQTGVIGPHVFSIEFLDDGVQAYAFTFG